MELQEAVDVRAPAAVVFEVLSTPERLPHWNPSVASARRVGSGPVRLGSRAQFSGRLFGQPLASETEVVGFDPPRWFATRAVRGPRLHTSFRLEPVIFGTRLALQVTGELPGGKLGSLVAERLLRKEFTTALDRLRAICEREARAAAEREAPEGGDPACWLHLQSEGPP